MSQLLRVAPPLAEPLLPPVFATVPDYGARLGDTAFWAPYVAAVLERHSLPPAPLEVGAVGTFPTFLAGRYVVKLFGEQFTGAVCHEVEVTLHRLLAAHPEIPAPALAAEGRLFAGEAQQAWPYVVTARLDGRPWNAAGLGPAQREPVAAQLGDVVRRLHALPRPRGGIWEQDWLPDMR